MDRERIVEEAVNGIAEAVWNEHIRINGNRSSISREDGMKEVLDILRSRVDDGIEDAETALMEMEAKW